MSTTLTNGLKLPDKGSVDWYSDMQNNYTILDGAVGTIAEHTTALAGKAPAVHTHVKADITDLFNSVNTWIGLNTYSIGQIRIKSQSQEIGVIPSSGVIQYLEFADKNNAQHGIVGLWDYAGGASEIQMYIADKFKNGAKDPTGTSESTFLSFGFKADGSKFLTFSGQVDNSVIPKSNNTYNLGDNSYQWNNLYAKNYYYNGVAWGLDKANNWTAFNRFNGYRLQIKHTSQEIGVIPSSNQWNGFNFVDKNENPTLTFEHAFMGSGETRFKISMLDNYASYESNSAVWIEFLRLSAYPGGNTFGIDADTRPLSNNLNLGSSTNKWKTLNGINPGALSLPNFDSDGYVDLSSNLTENVQYTYTPTVDGWLALFAQVDGFHAENAVGIFNADPTLGSDSFRWAASATAAINLSRQTGKYYGSVILPVKAGYRYYCWLRVDQSTTLGLKKLIFYKAKGNV